PKGLAQAVNSPPAQLPSPARSTRADQTMAAHWFGLKTFAETGDVRPGASDRLLHNRKLEGCMMALLVVPYFGDPQRIRLRWIFRNDIAQAARHRSGTFQQRLNHCSPMLGHNLDLADKSVHGVVLLGCCGLG